MKCKRGEVENMIWRSTTVNRIVKNTVYIGYQHHKFYEPDPSNPTPARKRQSRVLAAERHAWDIEVTPCRRWLLDL